MPVECAESSCALVGLIPTPDHELRLSDLLYVRMRVVVHSLATYGANTTRSAVPLTVSDAQDTFIHTKSVRAELVVTGDRTLCLPIRRATSYSVDLRSSEITRLI